MMTVLITSYAILCYNSRMKTVLKTIGMTPNESLVYEALVKLGGSSSAGDIIKTTDLHRNIVYDALAHLETRKLIQEKEKGKKKYFSLRDPEHLITEYKKQIESVGILSQILARLPHKSGHTVTVYEGSTAWQEAWQNMMRIIKPKTVFYTIGMAGDPWVKLMGQTFVAYEQWALKNGITNKIVSQKHLRAEIEAHQNKQFRDIRYIIIDLAVHTSIEIFDDRVFFELYDAPETLVEIKSKSLVITFQTYFDFLWKIGKR
jgi:sugar-specific transcriptional regulator TrmB